MEQAKKQLRTCSKGHQYYKSSDCPTCPVCEKTANPTTVFFLYLAAPARRALEKRGIRTLQELSRFSEDEILQLHGIGPSTIPKLKKALHENGLNFKQDSNRK